MESIVCALVLLAAVVLTSKVPPRNRRRLTSVKPSPPRTLLRPAYFGPFKERQR